MPTGKANRVKAATVSPIVSVPSPNAYFASACQWHAEVSGVGILLEGLDINKECVVLLFLLAIVERGIGCMLAGNFAP